MERFQAITRHHQFQPEGNCHLDTLSWSSGHFHASKSETVCRTAGRSPRLPPAPWTLPRLQPVASLEQLLRSAGHQESPLRMAGRRDLEAGKPQLSPWSSSRKLLREKLLHWRQPPHWQCDLKSCDIPGNGLPCDHLGENKQGRGQRRSTLERLDDISEPEWILLGADEGREQEMGPLTTSFQHEGDQERPVEQFPSPRLPEYWLEWTKNYFWCQFTHNGGIIHKKNAPHSTPIWFVAFWKFDRALGGLTTAVSVFVSSTNITTNIETAVLSC